MTTTANKTGRLAKEFTGQLLPLAVLQSAAGYYLGTADNEGPVSRESLGYWRTSEEAKAALASGDWNQNEI